MCRLYCHLDLDFVSLKLASWRPTCADNRSATYCACKNYNGKEVDLDGCKVTASISLEGEAGNVDRIKMAVRKDTSECSRL